MLLTLVFAALFQQPSAASAGAIVAGRVKWSHARSAADAAALTAASVLGGADRWDPRAVPAHPSAVRALDGPVR